MLDTTSDGQAVPSARDLAKVRMAYTKQKLEHGLADAVLSALGDADVAAKLAPAVALIAEKAGAAQLSTEETQEAILDALSDPKATTAEAFKMAALDRINMMWKAKGDADVPMHGRPTYGVGGSHDHGEGLRTKMIAGLSAKLSGKADTPMAREAAKMTMGDIIMTCAREARINASSPHEAVRMSGLWTRSDFPQILDTSMGNEVARRVAVADIAIQKAARTITRLDYRPSKLLDVSRTTMPEEVTEGAEIKHVRLTETGENSIELRDFAGIFAITKKALIDDRAALGLLQDIGGRMAGGAMDRKRAVLLEPLLANGGLGETMRDGIAMFDAAHGNLAPSGSALSVSSIGAASLSMRRLKGPQGEPLAVRPRFLVVPPELEMQARQIMATLAAATVNDVNPVSGSLEILVEDGLTDPTAWYLAADPALSDGLVLGLLEGQDVPQIKSKDGWETLSVEWRMWWPMDAAFTSTSACFKNPGA